ncbi:MAG: hypothetical protein CO113_15685 [Elusimicrobia bacterium CG_4_9_14_3_um_filter_62_55]|nr:MAG: hypothetical protein COR54_13815 [Elusimicrobia bacterium CG22_combo_CG10-13_8_21_14_all_63_91]PJA16736.1 MAG: hypothetical protein COX66_06715 [Elusimicrobia bacterium CG_4_10_14_0_2_um_filter_63_34]PJB24082.1 MAG: hypothetical protein CO113_15685 [Elusimicrobia bacterium CG_4_9_14_3_um_filter_62_55]
MAAIEAFLRDIDGRWKPEGEGKITLQVLGSCALMLQADYERGTKDGDVLETGQLTAPIKRRLSDLAGAGTDLHKRHRLYIDFVPAGLPFLPQRPDFHPAKSLADLRRFRVEVLDAADVVVSKLKRFKPDDIKDIRAMVVECGLVDHARLLERFHRAADWFSMDARSESLPRIVKNLNTVEREYFDAPPTRIELPEWG